MCCVLLLAAIALHAPAPFKGRPPAVPAIVPGSYLMTWSATPCETHFHADGAYACNWLGRWWQGRWRQEKGVLHVAEWPQETPAARYEWSARLACPATGSLSWGAAWRLGPLAPGRVD